LAIDLAAIVLTVGPKRINQHAVVEPFEAQRLAIVRVHGQVREEVGNELLKRFGPAAVGQAVALNRQPCNGAA